MYRSTDFRMLNFPAAWLLFVDIY